MNSTISRRATICARARVLVTAGLLCASASLAFGQTQPSTNRSRTFADACGPADPAYIHTANETGGIPIFLQRSETAKAFQLVRESTRNNVATVFWATGTIDGKPQAIKIPVDSVTQRITFTFSMDTKGNELKLTQPSGRSITEGSASTEVTELNCGRILTVSSPEAESGTGRLPAQADIGWRPRRRVIFISSESSL